MRARETSQSRVGSNFITAEEQMLQALNEKEVAAQYSKDQPQEPQRGLDKLEEQSKRGVNNDQSH